MNLSEQISGKSVLVTGASGFIGRHLCRRLLALGAQVHAISRGVQQSNSKYCQWWQADLTDSAAVDHIVKLVRPEIIVHLSSYVTGARELEVVLPTFYSNCQSSVSLLTAAAKAKCRRIVLAGSSEEPHSSNGEIFACSPYAAAKWATSAYGHMFHRLFNTPVVIPRIFMTYGPDQRDLLKLVPYVILQLLRNEVPKVSSGTRVADWIYIDDVVEGLIRAAIAPKIEGCSFDLGSGSLVSIREIVGQIVGITGSRVQPAFGALSERPYEQERAADTAFLNCVLGYRPLTSLRRGLELTVAWYTQQLNSMSVIVEPRPGREGEVPNGDSCVCSWSEE